MFLLLQAWTWALSVDPIWFRYLWIREALPGLPIMNGILKKLRRSVRAIHCLKWFWTKWFIWCKSNTDQVIDLSVLEVELICQDLFSRQDWCFIHKALSPDPRWNFHILTLLPNLLGNPLKDYWVERFYQNLHWFR